MKIVWPEMGQGVDAAVLSDLFLPQDFLIRDSEIGGYRR